MKKILLSALFCGFVLNNGYCFDEEHKITNEYLNESFGNFMTEGRKALDFAEDVNNDLILMKKQLRSKVLAPIDDRLCDIYQHIYHSFETFGPEFLKTVIPSGNDKGKQVRELLKEHKLNNDHMQMLCDGSVKYNVKGNGDRVTFELDSEIMEVYRSDYCGKVEYVSLHIPSLGFFDSVKLR